MKQGRKLFDHTLTRYGGWLLLAVVLVAGLLLRWAFFPYVSGDMERHLLRWMDSVREAGGFAALGEQIGNYTPAYMLLIAATSYLRFDSIVLIKAISVGADIFLAVGGYLLVWQLTRSQKRAAFAAALVFLLPTVVLNSSMWGQCDALFTGFLVFFLYFYYAQKPWLAMLCFWLGLAFKLQAVFLLPLVLLLVAAHRIKLRHVLGGFLGYSILFLPAMILRGDVGVLWSVYAGQSKEYTHRLSLEAPNLYSWMDVGLEDPGQYIDAGVAFGVCVIGVCLYALWLKRDRLDALGTFYAALLFSFLVPHVLPSMHERYFFVADILSLLLACCYLRWAPCAIAIQLTSFLVYRSFLLRVDMFPDLILIAAFSVGVLCVMTYRVLQYFGVSFASALAAGGVVADVTEALPGSDAEKEC